MKKTILLVALCLFTVRIFQAQTADDVIKKYFESVGGVEKWENLKSVKMTGDLVMPQGEFPVTLYRKTPNKFKIVLNVMGQELIPQAFDGETGWMVNPFAGSTDPQKLPDEQVQAMKEEAQFEDPFLNYKAKGYDASFEGQAETGGVNCNIIKLTRNAGDTARMSSSFYYFDADNGLQIMIKQSSPQTGGQEVEIYLSDYQDAGDGLMMPYVMDTQMQGQSVQKLTFKTISLNEDMPDDIFSFPAKADSTVN